jgi:hypothetical protein
VKKSRPGDSLGLLTIKEREERSKGFLLPKLEALLECFVAQNWQHIPLYWAGNAENVQNNSQKILLVKTKFFTIKI